LIYEDSRTIEYSRQFCGSLAGWYRADLRRVGVFGDIGQIATIAVGMTLKHDDGATLAAIISIIETAQIASARRVRSICDNLVRLGVVTREPAMHDNRARPLRFGSWLEPTLLAWLSLRIEAARPWLSRPAIADLPTLVQLLRYEVNALAGAGFYPGRAWPELRFFLDHTAGYPILLELICQILDPAGPAVIVGVSRKSLARRYGVSRPHVAGMLLAAEARGWFLGCRGRTDIAVSPASADRLRRWPAREIAWTVLALQAPG